MVRRVARDSDVVVVGGGPAGITTSLALATLAPHLRDRIVVLEKAVYPREKYCAGAVGGRGERILRALDAVPDVPSVPIDAMSVRVLGGEVMARVGATVGRVVRRIEYDHALARTATARGVRVLDGTRVDAVVRDGAHALVETSRGAMRAKIVVGADGVGSVVRKAMGLPPGELRAQVLEVDTEPVKGDRHRGVLHFDASDRRFSGYTWDFPTIVDGRPLVCRGIYHLKVDDRPVDIKALLDERFSAMGLRLEAYRNKRFAERGWVRSPTVVDEPFMLVGEAAGIDPISGEGIAQAIEYGWLAGRFLSDVLTRARRVDDWRAYLGRSRLARDLSLRTRGMAAFYGPRRPHIERFLLRNPSVLHVGAQHFAHLPYDHAKLAGVLLRGTLAWAAMRA